MEKKRKELCHWWSRKSVHSSPNIKNNDPMVIKPIIKPAEVANSHTVNREAVECNPQMVFDWIITLLHPWLWWHMIEGRDLCSRLRLWLSSLHLPSYRPISSGKMLCLLENKNPLHIFARKVVTALLDQDFFICTTLLSVREHTFELPRPIHFNLFLIDLCLLYKQLWATVMWGLRRFYLSLILLLRLHIRYRIIFKVFFYFILCL